MSIVKKVVGVLFVILGGLMILLSFGGLGFSFLAIGVLCIIAAVGLFKSNKKAAAVPPEPSVGSDPIEPEVAPAVSEPIRPKESRDQAADNVIRYSFNVAGISHYEDGIKDSLLDENDWYAASKSELIEFNYVEEPVYRYEESISSITLEAEPDNQYDERAIKVVADGILVGYVPAKSISRVTGILEKKNPDISWELVGGPYKIVRLDDDDNYVMEKHDLNLGLKITLSYAK